MRTGIASTGNRMRSAAVRRSVPALLVLLLLLGCGSAGGNTQGRPQDSPEQLGQAFTVAVYKGEFDQAASYVVPAFRSAAQSSFPGMQTTLQGGGFQRVESATAVDYDAGMKKVFIKGGTWTGQLLVVQSGDEWFIQDVLEWASTPSLRSTTASTPGAISTIPPTPAQLPGTMNGVSAQGSYLYGLAYNKLAVIDIQNPTQPALAALMSVEGGSTYEMMAVAVERRYAYLAWGRGLSVIDISNPIAPVEVSSLATHSGFSLDLALWGSYAYIGGYGGLTVVDISAPTAPKRVGSFSPDPYGMVDVHGVEVSADGKYAYLLYGNTLGVLDISNPTDPVLVGSYERTGTMGISIRLYDAVVENDRAYVTDESGSLLVLNIVDPAHPALVSQLKLDYTGPAPFPPEAEGIGLVSKYTYVGFGTDLRVVDVSNPATLVEVGAYQTPPRKQVSHTVVDMVVVGKYAYLACGESGLWVLNVSDPAAPVEVRP